MIARKIMMGVVSGSDAIRLRQIASVFTCLRSGLSFWASLSQAPDKSAVVITEILWVSEACVRKAKLAIVVSQTMSLGACQLRFGGRSVDDL